MNAPAPATAPRNGSEAPPRLAVEVLGASVDPAAATPSVALELGVTAPPEVPIRSALLRAQVRIDVRRRSYDDDTRERLREVFGRPEQWGDSLRSLLWAQSAVTVPAFTGEARVTLPLPCTYDFEVAAAKVLQGLRDGVVPLQLLFSGTLFYAGPDGALRTAMLPWDVEARHALPVALWREAIDRFFPGAAWLRLDRDSFDRLYAYRNRHALPSWEATVDALLEEHVEKQTEEDA